MIFDLDHLAVGGRLSKPEDRAAIDPGVARHNAVGLAGPQKDGWQWFHKLLEHTTRAGSAKGERAKWKLLARSFQEHSLPDSQVKGADDLLHASETGCRVIGRLVALDLLLL